MEIFGHFMGGILEWKKLRVQSIFKKLNLSLTTPLKHIGDVDGWLHSALTSALYGGEMPTPGPGSFTR
jgi:hypothetical protein